MQIIITGMKQKIFGFLSVFLTWIVIFMLQKPLFMLMCKDSVGEYSLFDVFVVMYHGLPLDMSMGGYLTLLPALLIAVSVWTCCNWLKIVWRAYFVIASLLVSTTFSLNIGLYPYWKFRLPKQLFF